MFQKVYSIAFGVGWRTRRQADYAFISFTNIFELADEVRHIPFREASPHSLSHTCAHVADNNVYTPRGERH
jgi:hypothetical protein